MAEVGKGVVTGVQSRMDRALDRRVAEKFRVDRVLEHRVGLQLRNFRR